ncbi:MAG: hypothetical protein NPINA01_06080 [Nitrospinaceae bacterium]|nr:MAG: hypothetical protein NPINA01_06080 [Nitrospinaceae bacterium]
MDSTCTRSYINKGCREKCSLDYEPISYFKGLAIAKAKKYQFLEVLNIMDFQLLDRSPVLIVHNKESSGILNSWPDPF